MSRAVELVRGGGMLKDGIVFAFGQMLTKISFFLLIPLYVQHMTVDQYGIVGYTQGFIIVGIALFGFGGVSFQERYFYELIDNDDSLRSMFFTVNVFSMCFSLTLGLLLCVLGYYFWKLTVPFDPYIILSVFIAYFSSLNQFSISLNIPLRKSYNFVFEQFLHFLFISMFSLFFVVFCAMEAKGYLIGVLLGNILFFLIFYRRFFYLYRGAFSFKWVALLLPFGAPIVLHSISGTILSFIDRVYIERNLDLSELGIYSLASQAAMLITVFGISMSRVWQPRFFQLMSKDLERARFESRKMVFSWTCVGGIVTIVAISGSLFLAGLLFSPEYYRIIEVLPIILVSNFLTGLYFIFVTPLFYFKRTSLIPVISVTSAVLNILFNILLVSRFGIVGAAVATLISSGSMVLISFTLSRRMLKINLERGRALFLNLLICIYLLMFTSVEAVNYKVLFSIIYCLIFFFISKALDIKTKYLSLDKG